ncbi:TetR/AcrR family transcriptional regulator [Paenibacillus filicis]|uniref:TetR/AcrR family transcriptional regulator n=1 Tax=Paenibacillus filicis TaxID=669464 RepID=A0ABU9DVC4_9BACL
MQPLQVKEGIIIRKGEKTKQFVIEKTALLLNQRGFLSTSLAEITDATGLQKGGLYNHFKDKEELMLESFKHCCALVNEQMEPVMASQPTSLGQLTAFIDFYCGLDFPGGCPIVNATVEAHAVSPPLYEQAGQAMDNLLAFIGEIIQSGISSGEIRAQVIPKDAALFILSAVEGGLVMHKLYPGNSSITTVREQLFRYIESELKK